MRPRLAANRCTSPGWRLLSSTDRYGMEMDSLHLAQAWRGYGPTHANSGAGLRACSCFAAYSGDRRDRPMARSLRRLSLPALVLARALFNLGVALRTVWCDVIWGCIDHCAEWLLRLYQLFVCQQD